MQHANFSAIAFCAPRFGLPAWNLFAMRNGERLRVREEYQVFYFIRVDDEEMDVRSLKIAKEFTEREE